MVIDWSSLVKKYTKPKGHMFPLGMTVYKGLQGCGKSLSLTKDAFDIKKDFPECVVFSNMYLYGIEYNFYKSVSDLVNCLSYKNGDKGVLIIIDEAQNYFNKKTGVPLEIMAQLCQNRKNRRCILMTSQIWEDLDVMVRKQVKTVVNCRCILGKFQLNTYHNGESLSFDKLSGEYVAPKRFTKIFKHNNEYYNRYNTLEIIETNESYNRTLTMGQGAPPAPVSVSSNNLKRKVFKL